jgi:hypothetical protein
MTNTPMIHIDGLSIRLESVRPELQRNYALAQAAVASTTGPRQNVEKAKLNEITKTILIEATPHLMLKASPRHAGAAGFFEATNRRG